MSEASLSDQRLDFVKRLFLLAREHGAKHLSVDGVEIELSPLLPESTMPTTGAHDLPNAMCACGHHRSIHRGSVCLDCGPEEPKCAVSFARRSV